MDIEIEIRKFCQSDSVEELTNLLHRAYKRLADMGLEYWAQNQDNEITLSRISKGECFLVENEKKLIGTISYFDRRKPSQCSWYEKEGVAYFGQFAVEPDFQNKGVGSVILKFIEVYAKCNGIKELALDTSEKAPHLIEYYKKRGYRFIQYQQWDAVSYRNVVMSKTLV